MTISPGTYLRKRREAAGLSVTAIAIQIATEPRLAEHGRVDWIGGIEQDTMPARFETLVVLRNLFPFDFGVLERLVQISLGADLPAPQICRVCACSEHDACKVPPFGACWWLTNDLCTSCDIAAVLKTGAVA